METAVLVLIAVVITSLVVAVVTVLTSGWVSSLVGSSGFLFPLGAAGAVYRRQQARGKVTPAYPPPERRSAARPGPARPGAAPVWSALASQFTYGRSRGGHLRLFEDQLRFDPYRASPSSPRAWVATREEVTAVTRTRGRVWQVSYTAPRLTTVMLTDGTVADFSLRRRRHLELQGLLPPTS